MVRITFLPDHKGTKKALGFIEEIRQKSVEGNEYYTKLIIYITRGLEHLRQNGVSQESSSTFFTTTKLGGTGIITFQLTKPLRYHPPLWEMRINFQPMAFRAIFFPYIREDKSQILFFTHAMLKSQKSSPAFEKLIQESEVIVKDFFANPQKYLQRRGE